MNTIMYFSIFCCTIGQGHVSDTTLSTLRGTVVQETNTVVFPHTGHYVVERTHNVVFPHYKVPTITVAQRTHLYLYNGFTVDEEAHGTLFQHNAVFPYYGFTVVQKTHGHMMQFPYNVVLF